MTKQVNFYVESFIDEVYDSYGRIYQTSFVKETHFEEVYLVETTVGNIKCVGNQYLSVFKNNVHFVPLVKTLFEQIDTFKGSLIGNVNGNGPLLLGVKKIEPMKFVCLSIEAEKYTSIEVLTDKHESIFIKAA